MKQLISEEQKENNIKYERYKKLVRNLRRGRNEKISPKKTNNNITKI